MDKLLDKKVLSISIMTLLVMLVGTFFVFYNDTFAHESDASSLEGQVEDLKKEIEEQQTAIEELLEEAKQYEKNIKIKQGEAVTLENQIALIENRVAKILIDIEIKERQIDENNTSIAVLTQEIHDKEDDITYGKRNLSRYIQIINENDTKSYLNILFVERSFSRFFDAIESTKRLNSDMKTTLTEVHELKNELLDEQNALDEQNKELATLKIALENKQIDLEEEQRLKQFYLEETKSSEEKFQELFWQTKQDEFAIRDEIRDSERAIQEKLKEIAQQKGDVVESDENAPITLSNPIFAWPVPSRTITAGFHDPDYPFRHVFEHPAIDIRASQGTVIRAPADGYVGRVRDNGYGYSYIMLIHGDGFSTVYGHVSRIDVQEDTYVRQGDPIGLTGGMPGTLGAGNLSTGPHLHFEIRLNGIPVNPVNYLP